MMTACIAKFGRIEGKWTIFKEQCLAPRFEIANFLRPLSSPRFGRPLLSRSCLKKLLLAFRATLDSHWNMLPLCAYRSFRICVFSHAAVLSPDFRSQHAVTKLAAPIAKATFPAVLLRWWTRSDAHTKSADITVFSTTANICIVRTLRAFFIHCVTWCCYALVIVHSAMFVASYRLKFNWCQLTVHSRWMQR